MSKISDLVAYAKANPTNTAKEINFGNVPNFQAQDINSKTGVRVNGAKKVLSNHGITHTFKRHGDDETEKKSNQKGITDLDFELIPNILSEPDNVIRGSLNSMKEQTLLFVKKVNKYTYTVVVALKQKEGVLRLHFNTMYAKK